MNKRQIEQIAEEYINFSIETPYFKSRALNSSEISFYGDGLICIKGKMNDGDVFIQTKDIKTIIGVGKK